MKDKKEKKTTKNDIIDEIAIIPKARSFSLFFCIIERVEKRLVTGYVGDTKSKRNIVIAYS